MKKLFILLLIIPILGFSQNDLVFNRVLNFNVTEGQPVTVPQGKAWKIEYGVSSGAGLKITTTNQPYGNDLTSINSNSLNTQSINGSMWLGAGCTISVDNNNPNMISILEFNVVAASSSSGGSDNTGGNTDNSSNNSDGYNNSSTSTIYDGNITTFSSPGEDFTDAEGNTYSTTIIDDLVWTTSNANHSTYRDGTPIPYIENYVDWYNNKLGAYTYLAQEDFGYGKLYNYQAIIGLHDSDTSTPNKTFAPEGWRVPSYTDWMNLKDKFSIPGLNSGSGLATRSKTDWVGAGNGNNNSGLNVKPWSFINYGTANDWGAYVLTPVGQRTAFWRSVTANNQTGAYSVAIYNTSADLGINVNGYYNTGVGYYDSALFVRLIKNTN